jgi:hypothetical protein
MIFVTSVGSDALTRMRTASGQLRLLAFCLLIGAILSIIDRTDVNWDLQNYHLYGPFAVLHGRLGADYFVAGIQGYLNPLADIPYYVTKFILFPAHPVIVAGLAGLPFGLLAFIVFNIARIMLPHAAAEAALAAVLGVTGATILSEVGTVYDDILIADVLLLGLWAALAKPGSPAVSAICGLAVGCAAGLKLTALLFAPGLLVFCLIQAPRLRPAVQSAALFCIAAAIGFLLTWGWWGLALWQRFHNPFFPVFGSIFPSPWSPTIFIQDTRFFPRAALQWLFYPFFWLQGRSFIASKEALRDPRLALVYLALAAGLLAAFTGRVARPPRKIAACWAFFALSYFFWLVGFSILRYALPLEAISGIVIWTAIRPLLQKSKPLLVLTGICVVVIAFTKPIGWGRIGYGKTLIEAPIPSVAPHSLVFISGAPISFVVPYLNSQGSAFVSLDWLASSSAEFPAVRLLAAKAAEIRLLTNAPTGAGGAAAIDARLARFGLSYSEDSCLPVHTPVQRTIRLCDVRPLLP